MADFVQTLMSSLATGSLYALIALGYTMVYGILKFINFAHSDIVVLGAWSSFSVAARLLPIAGFDRIDRDSVPPLWVAFVVLVLAMAICSVTGFLIERLAYRPLRRARGLNVLITAIGVSLLLQNVGQLHFVFGASPRRMPSLLPAWELCRLTFGEGAAARSVTVSLIDAIILSSSAALMLLLQFLVFHTRLGIAMRAAAEDRDTAALMGIPVDRVVSCTFVLGSALAGAAGFLYAMKYPGINQPAHSIWMLLGLKSFVAAVIGGIGNLPGAVLGGFVIATVEQFGAYYVSSGFRDVYVFALLILILLVRPAGILGSTLPEKV